MAVSGSARRAITSITVGSLASMAATILGATALSTTWSGAAFAQFRHHHHHKRRDTCEPVADAGGRSPDERRWT